MAGTVYYTIKKVTKFFMSIDTKSLNALFNTLNKQTSDSYHKQRNFIKKVLIGKISTCPICQQTLIVDVSNIGNLSRIHCRSKCTDIEFEAD